ncbi:MAG: DUF1800 domain-containing protein, partial [Chloroflexi bacterium]|nr:DUF1800 domain-containing protein [Chloroflexota bacterium]
KVIHMLATHPSTARFVSTKLARRFVSDEPPASLEEAASMQPGDHWPRPTNGTGADAVPPGPREHARPGEALFAVGGRWRIAVPDRLEVLEAPASAIVLAADAGHGIRLRLPGRALLGRTLLGDATRGQLEGAAGPRAELRASAIDVARSGAVLVAGAHVDAEALTRARATGVRGIVVGSLAASVRRDLAAAEARRRASLHVHAPFGILVLDGTGRRPISGPANAILSAAEGVEVALIGSPAALVVDDRTVAFPEAPANLVRVIGGPLAGREGRWLELAARSTRGTADPLVGLVDLGADGLARISIGDLERYT